MNSVKKDSGDKDSINGLEQSHHEKILLNPRCPQLRGVQEGMKLDH